ncbi:MAG: dihydroorotate dehydrogenase electron transfer subunit [Dehalococcoidales bacterium]
MAAPAQVSAPVMANDEVMPGVYLAWLESPQIASVVKPGQFVMVRCGDDNLLRRPFSVHRLDEQKKKLALLYAVVGRGTRWLSQLGEGDTADILGPLGNGFRLNPDAKRLLLIAGGMGVAPLCFLARQASRKGCSPTLLLGAQTAAQLPIHLLPSLSSCVTATEDGSAGHKGVITECLPDYVSQADQIFACGPTPMYRSLKDMPELKNRPVQISLEVRMACGFGVCYGCTVKTTSGLKQVCQDGPVFDLNEIIWQDFADI